MLSFRFNMQNFSRQEIIYVLILVSLVVFTRIILVSIAPNMYFFDSYGFVNKALDLVYNGQISFGAGLPFIFLLGFCLYSFSWVAPPLIIVQSIMISFSIITILILYLIAKKISGTLFAFLGSILAAFEPYFISYSIVGHNDVFAIALGLASFYFVIATKKLNYIITPFLFYMAVGTRPELYPVFSVPILLFTVYKNWKSNLRQKMILVAYLVLVYLLPIIWISTIMPYYTRFSPIQRMILFLNPELIGIVLTNIFNFYSQESLNTLFLLLCFLGVLTWFINALSNFFTITPSVIFHPTKFSLKECMKFIRNLLKSERFIVGICMCLIFGIYVVILTTFGFGYVITDDKLSVIKSLPARYTILPRLIISFLLAYPISLFSTWVYDKIMRNK